VGADLIAALAGIVGDAHLSTRDSDRLVYSVDASWLPQMTLDRGVATPRPDVIVYPSSAEEVARILAVAHQLRVPVLPWGGGSGTQGGTLPIHNGIIVDLKRLDRILEIDETSLSVTAQAGINGAVLEWALGDRGLTLPHYPASAQCATLGGYLAPRGSGTISTKYGKAEDLVMSLEVVLPTGSSIKDEIWVNVTYRSRDGQLFTLTQEWLVYETDGGTRQLASQTTRKKRAAIDIKKTKINHLRRTLFAPRNVSIRKSLRQKMYAETRSAEGREFGYIRLFSFDVDDPDEFVKDFAEVITSDGFPQEGLIIDVRGNPGGKIRAGERLLQLFTPRRVSPELFEFLNTPLNLEICRLAPERWNVLRWADSIAESVVTGATYSSGFPLNSEASCNDMGQRYYGPVILITDALSYSTTDMFAAGFQDNQIGEVLGTSDNTGAGGANVWWYDDLVKAVKDSPQSPFKPLPRGADMALALRRSIRVGRHAGRPLEELGIVPDQRHYMTSKDLLGSNEDLIRRAARILISKPVYLLRVKPFEREDGTRGIVVTAQSKVTPPDAKKNISRVDVYVNGRPIRSLDATRGALQAKRLILGESRNAKINLLLEARDAANNLVAVYQRTLKRGQTS